MFSTDEKACEYHLLQVVSAEENPEFPENREANLPANQDLPNQTSCSSKTLEGEKRLKQVDKSMIASSKHYCVNIMIFFYQTGNKNDSTSGSDDSSSSSDGSTTDSDNSSSTSSSSSRSSSPVDDSDRDPIYVNVSEDESTDFDEGSTDARKKNTRKRKRNPEGWKRNIAKKLRNTGKVF